MTDENDSSYTMTDLSRNNNPKLESFKEIAQLLNSLQGTMATIDPYSVKKEAIDEYRIDTIEERLTRIEDKVDLLISQLKIEFYKKNDGTSR
jgi:cob(I)alamin adenosyltransferase